LLPRGGGGFVYYISRTGVTGEKEALAPELSSEVAALRGRTSLPIAVGFGIGTGDQFRRVAALADGVVVGSAIVRAVGEAPGDRAGAARAAARRIAGARSR